MRTVNSTLASDYSAFLPYTSNDNTNASATIGTLFSGRNYRSIAVANATIESDVLTNNVWGRYISLDFTQTSDQNPPALTILEGLNEPVAIYTLLRSDGGGLFTPVPVTRYFLNTTDLNSSTNISATINADVVDVSSSTGGTRYAYVALYIVVTGIDGNFSPIYSAPTFIGVLRLPDVS
jgi:hypothetical protein